MMQGSCCSCLCIHLQEHSFISLNLTAPKNLGAPSPTTSAAHAAVCTFSHWCLGCLSSAMLFSVKCATFAAVIRASAFMSEALSVWIIGPACTAQQSLSSICAATVHAQALCTFHIFFYGTSTQSHMAVHPGAHESPSPSWMKLQLRFSCCVQGYCQNADGQQQCLGRSELRHTIACPPPPPPPPTHLPCPCWSFQTPPAMHPPQQPFPKQQQPKRVHGTRQRGAISRAPDRSAGGEGGKGGGGGHEHIQALLLS